MEDPPKSPRIDAYRQNNDTKSSTRIIDDQVAQLFSNQTNPHYQADHLDTT